MKRYLITGISSGIGRELTRELIRAGNHVWGVARRAKLLASLETKLAKKNKFRYSTSDLTEPRSWIKITQQMRQAKFFPDVVIFNAAIFQKDFSETGAVNLKTTRDLIETNFFSILEGLNQLFKLVKAHTKFIFIGSASAFKGGGEEGIGYCASKAALTQAMESLYLKHQGQYEFKIVHFGPVATDMLPLRQGIQFVISANQAAHHIIKSIHAPGHIFHYPTRLFLFLRFIKILPTSIYLWILSKIDAFHRKNKKC